MALIKVTEDDQIAADPFNPDRLERDVAAELRGNPVDLFGERFDHVVFGVPFKRTVFQERFQTAFRSFGGVGNLLEEVLNRCGQRFEIRAGSRAVDRGRVLRLRRKGNGGEEDERQENERSADGTRPGGGWNCVYHGNLASKWFFRSGFGGLKFVRTARR